jgi:hypothetical protein
VAFKRLKAIPKLITLFNKIALSIDHLGFWFFLSKCQINKKPENILGQVNQNVSKLSISNVNHFLD